MKILLTIKVHYAIILIYFQMSIDFCFYLFVLFLFFIMQSSFTSKFQLNPCFYFCLFYFCCVFFNMQVEYGNCILHYVALSECCHPVRCTNLLHQANKSAKYIFHSIYSVSQNKGSPN